MRLPCLSSEGEIIVVEDNIITLTLQGIDPDGDNLTYNATNLPAGAELDPITGQFTWTPNFLTAGIYEDIEFTVTDGHSNSSQTISITVANNNRPPVLTPLTTQATREDTELIFNIKGTDIDRDPILYSAID